MPTKQQLEEAQESRLLVSDPTARTRASILREFEVVEKLSTQRMDAIEKAVEVAHQDRVRFPTEIVNATAALEKLFAAHLATHMEKFQGIEKQFKERDQRTVDSVSASEKALQAGLKAAKEIADEQNKSSAASTDKSERAMIAQMAQMQILIETVRVGFDRSITELKERLTREEAIALGRNEQRGEQRDTTNDRLGVSSLWTAIAGLILGLIAFGAGIFINK